MVAFGAEIRPRRIRRGAAGLVALVAGLVMVSGCANSATTTATSSAPADPSTMVVVPSDVKAPANLNDSFLDDVALAEVKNDPRLKSIGFDNAKCFFRLENNNNESPGKWVVPSPTPSGGWKPSLIICGPADDGRWEARGVILDDSGMLIFGAAVPGGPDEWQVAAAGEKGFRFDGETVTTT